MDFHAAAGPHGGQFESSLGQTAAQFLVSLFPADRIRVFVHNLIGGGQRGAGTCRRFDFSLPRCGRCGQKNRQDKFHAGIHVRALSRCETRV